MMDLIDRSELEPDTEWSEYYDGFTSYSQSQINGAVEVQAIPLDKVKQARRELDKLPIYGAKFTDDFRIHLDREEVFSILDKLIAESEG